MERSLLILLGLLAFFVAMGGTSGFSLPPIIFDPPVEYPGFGPILATDLDGDGAMDLITRREPFPAQTVRTLMMPSFRSSSIVAMRPLVDRRTMRSCPQTL